MNILVTGVAGFIGSNLAEVLLKNGVKVIGIDNFDNYYSKNIKLDNLKDLLKDDNFIFYEQDIQDLKIQENIDLIIHIAAKAGVRASIENPTQYIESNIIGTQKLLDFAISKNINKVIFASSSSIYGNSKTPFEENGLKDNPISPYAYTKKACEIILNTYYNLYRLNFIALRFFTVYGPRQRPDLAINKFISLIEKDEPITIYGDGKTGRDYTFIDDIINGIIKSIDYLLSNSSVSEIINLGNSKPIILKEMIDTIYKCMDKEPKIIYKPMQKGDVDFTFADIQKAYKLLNYSPEVSFEEGIYRYIKWRVNVKN
jgi:nucleoside-diphosphate-sugar epimerase